MLIKNHEVISAINNHGIKVTGALHIGAYACEELPFYLDLGLNDDEIVWIDAMQSQVNAAKVRGVRNIYQSLITDTDDEDVVFKISSNVQSSSVLDFGTHSKFAPNIKVVKEITLRSITVDTFFARNNIDSSKYNLWNFDIQGAELMALRGAVKSLSFADALYLEVNNQEVYKDCALIDDVDSFLSGFGFVREITRFAPAGWGDALYIRS